MRGPCLIAVTMTLTLGCAGDTATCVAEPEPDCTAAYAGSYALVYENTITRSCSVGGGACHGVDDPLNGLSLVGEDASLQALLDGGWVIPGEVSCSELFVRIADHGHPGAMPPGAPLSEEETCAIGQWIEQGALP